MRVEHRYCEVRAVGAPDSRRIEGVLVRYGDVADLGQFSERIQRGALEWDDVTLNIQHDRGRPIARTGSGLTLGARDDGVRLAADVAPTRAGDDALQAVRAGLLRGLSVEMVVRSDDWQDVYGARNSIIRTITGATVRGVGLVDRPAYPDSAVARAALDDVLATRPRAVRRWL